MTSELKVDKITPASGTNTQIGEAGDTITIPSGCTITNSGTATNFGASLSGSTDNTVVTVTGANAMQGESSLTWNGSSLGVGIASPETSAHIQSASGECELRLTAASTSDARLRFGDTTTTAGGYIGYNRSTQTMYFRSANSGAAHLQISDNGYLYSPPTSSLTTSQSPNVYINSGGTFKKSTSALKYKKDVRDLESIDINTLRPVRYKSNIAEDETNEDFIGFIADEFHDAGLTELVTYEKPDEEGNPVVGGFNYDRLTAVLTKALQDANKKIETLEARVTALESA
tara:strand:- start:747 stop:1607 length:861 start_codon:yes stop_codon:yes gene_type:complete